MGSGGLPGRHLALLRGAPSFRALFLATLGSGLGTGLAVIALTVDVFDRTGSGKWVAALLIAEFLPMLVIGLLLAPLIDRLSRRSVMIASDLLRVAVFCALPFATSPAMIVALAAVAGLATGLFRPAVYAGMPNLVHERDLPQANALFQAVENLTWLLGPLLGGLLLAASGPDVAYWLNAATFLLSAALVYGIPKRMLQIATAPTRGHFRDLGDGFRAVRQSRALVTVIVAWTVVMLANAHVNVAEVSLAKVSFASGNVGLGVLMAAAGLGLMLGSLAGGSWVEQRPMAVAYGTAIALMGIGVGLAAIAPNVWVAAACVVVSGFGNGVAGVCNPVLVQRGAPDHLRGRAFTVIMSVNTVFLGVGMALAGPVVDAWGARWAWGGAAAVNVVAAVIAFVLARGIAAGPVEEDLEPVSLVPVAAPQAAQGERAL
ncbi:MAG: MFS transporter [Gaiellaceae bacterium]